MQSISTRSIHFKLRQSLFFLLFVCNLIAQEKEEKNNVFVDKNGVMRWENNKSEVHGFGVNYTMPFAHAYRQAKKMDIDPKKAIDQEVYHFWRLGFDLYRVHVWDTQISDVKGNLLENEHLDTFDYLLYKLKEYNINYVITPIAFWGDGWPESDTETPGFSNTYGKDQCLVNEDAIKAQENYLYQFLIHQNPYTKLSYKDDPSVIAFEVSNEPHHRGTPEEVQAFVRRMVQSIRKTGTKKPIFYNMSHAIQYTEEYLAAGIQGGTFQWYPTGLGYQRELSGNLLPNVNEYDIPFEKKMKAKNAAKLVYEFDAADVDKSYIYPAMARSFRTAGIQIATHFAYDPTFLAPYNTEYNTHYMNLAYAPQKALGLKISSEVFRQIPLYQTFEKYPQNLNFYDFHIDYESDLAEYNTDTKFFYTNHTQTLPKNQQKLREIAGFGNSRIIQYKGAGAYFLDKLGDGTWRLEVMPDALRVRDPFGKNSPEKIVTVIQWNENDMTIHLNNLGNTFSIKGLNEGNNYEANTSNGQFKITPGTYLLSKEISTNNGKISNQFKSSELNTFFAPKANLDQNWLKNITQKIAIENTSFKIKTQFISPASPKKIEVMGYLNNQYMTFTMQKTGTFDYEVEIPSNTLFHGYFRYHIIVQENEKDFYTYPAEKKGRPYDWDFYDKSTYEIEIIPPSFPIELFNAKEDATLLVAPWRNTFKLVPSPIGTSAYQINLEELFVKDPENTEAKPLYDYSFKHYIVDEIQALEAALPTKTKLVFYGKSLNNKPCKLQIALVMNDGHAYGKVIEIDPLTKDYGLNLSDLKPVRTVTLPRPYPTFLPYYLDHQLTSPFDLTKVESVQFSIGPEIPKDALNQKHGIEIVSLRLE
ncbi:hypothetical protein [Namhaeicola litoreus]|uniref:Cellulase (Glycosyl hydrolase family 5) n=1 Tax=Namhaeicola litoreus TaxID=1052145 RepID=A0ABW3XY35_9FLAO